MLHFFLSFFLFLEELPLAGDISSIELRSHVLAECRYILTSDDIASDSCLDRDRELCFWYIVLQLLADLPTEIARSSSVYHHREGVYRISGDSDIHLHDIIYLVSHRLIVEARISR